jgi:hypothetical protein
LATAYPGSSVKCAGCTMPDRSRDANGATGRQASTTARATAVKFTKDTFPMTGYNGPATGTKAARLCRSITELTSTHG